MRRTSLMHDYSLFYHKLGAYGSLKTARRGAEIEAAAGLARPAPGRGKATGVKRGGGGAGGGEGGGVFA